METTKTTVTCNTQLALSIETNETTVTVTFGNYQKKFDPTNYPKDACSFSNFANIMQNITITKCVKKDGADEYDVKCEYNNGVAFKFDFVLAKRNPNEIMLESAIKKFEQELNVSFCDVINTHLNCGGYFVAYDSSTLTCRPSQNIENWNQTIHGRIYTIYVGNPLEKCCSYFANLTQQFIRTCSVLLRNHIVQTYFISLDKHDKTKTLAENIVEFKKLDFVSIMLSIIPATLVLQYPIVNLFVRNYKIDFAFKYANVNLAELFKKLNVTKFAETVFDELVAPNNELLKFGKPYFTIYYGNDSTILANSKLCGQIHYTNFNDVKNDVAKCGFQFAHIYPIMRGKNDSFKMYLLNYGGNQTCDLSVACHIETTIYNTTNSRTFQQHCDKIDLEQHLSV